MFKAIPFLLLWLIGMSLLSCQGNGTIVTDEDSEEFRDTTLTSIEEYVSPDLTIHEGYVSMHEEKIRILRNGEPVAIVRLSEPQIIAQSERNEEWGFFQFPKIFRAANGNLLVYWQMREDSYTAYGEEGYGVYMSSDEGETWGVLDRGYFIRGSRRYEFPNGNVLEVIDRKPKDVNSYTSFPDPVNTEPINGYNFYYENELPEDLRGVYFVLWDKNSNVRDTIHSSIIDSGSLLRYSIDDKIPMEWWGDFREKGDGALVTGIYPVFYVNSEGKVLNYTTSFYESKDWGHSWSCIGSIPQRKEYDGGEGYSEPTFVILNNGVYLCVMRTGSISPMVRSFSFDYGKSWSEPEPFTPNGVYPQLLLLDSGMLILASGRPGLQLRFCIDGDGMTWTEPIEMMPIMNENGNIDVWGRSCGYPYIMPVDSNTLYMVYSDFKTKDINGEYRKSIIFRRIEVIKKP